jgi:hypothetical protein
MSDFYRDPSEGRRARRLQLVQRRRDELVELPHAVRRVAVRRGARIAAGYAAASAALVLHAAIIVPSFAALLARAMPGLEPAPLATLVAAGWAVAIVVWAVARALGASLRGAHVRRRSARR